MRELEKHGMVSRKVYAEVPPRTECALTKRGERAIPVIESLRQYGIALIKDVGIESDFYLGTEKPEALTVKAKKASR